MLITLISNKLLQDSKLALGGNFKDRDWNINEMLNNLRTEIKARRKQFDSTPNFKGKEKLSSQSDELFSSHFLLILNKRVNKKSGAFCFILVCSC